MGSTVHWHTHDDNTDLVMEMLEFQQFLMLNFKTNEQCTEPKTNKPHFPYIQFMVQGHTWGMYVDIYATYDVHVMNHMTRRTIHI